MDAALEPDRSDVLLRRHPDLSQAGPISQRSEYIVLSSEVARFFAGTIPTGGYGTRARSTTNVQVDYVRVWTLD